MPFFEYEQSLEHREQYDDSPVFHPEAGVSDYVIISADSIEEADKVVAGLGTPFHKGSEVNFADYEFIYDVERPRSFLHEPNGEISAVGPYAPIRSHTWNAALEAQFALLNVEHHLMGSYGEETIAKIRQAKELMDEIMANEEAKDF